MTRTAPLRFSLRSASAPLWLATWLLLCGLLASSAWAQQEPPGRVGRLAELQGAVSWWDHEAGRWDPAERNHPLTGGDRISTGPDGRAELSVGSSVLRIGAGSELEVLRLDDERMVFQLHSGKLALRLRNREMAVQTEIDTAEVRLLP
ncbi:MAG: FecR family protein, partial [Pseudomonadota bacterium]|nr:FecR family protein [Pseudomonadota bacterium]